MTVLLWAIIGGAPAHAADANWDGASLKYDGLQYISAGMIQKDDGSNLPVGSPYYIYTEQYQAPGSSDSITRARIIYFSPGVDPPSATSATTVTFNYDTAAKKFSNPVDQKTISLDTSSVGSAPTSCAIDGIGWAVCPIMNFLSKGMDVVFNLIADYMKVQPLQTGNTQGSLYTAWNVMRNIANVAFIIVFIIIIYSQLTNIQVNNYGLKRLLPRLIIAAVAINLSYIICAIAVDLSNVLGYSLQDVFNGLRNQILSTGNSDNSAAVLSWQSITGFVLSGGTAALAAGIGIGSAIIATGGTITAAVFILLPALVGLLLAILVVLLVLAARQALIVILVIIAPIALVAYLLPNTEKWFKKWRELLMTMLIFFPAFSVVFGGSQLAGAIIIKNATSINMIILGMIVQVAPLVITPLLLKFSGSLLGNIAKLVNNPNKGIIDRTRNWSKSHADLHRGRGISGNKFNGDPGKLGKGNVIRKSARYLDQRKRRRADRTGNAETATQTNYENSRLYTKPNRKGGYKYDMAVQKATFEDKKNATHSHHAAHVDAARRTQGSIIYEASMDARAQKAAADTAQARTDTFYNNVLKNERLANRVGGSALHSNGYQLEVAKSRLEASESLKADFYQTQRATQGTRLHAASITLENSKLKAEASQNTYTAVIDSLKATPTSGLSMAAQTAQSSKELAEAAQHRVQELFDQQRRTLGTDLNISSIRLEESRLGAETSKSLTAEFIKAEKLAVGSDLHLATIRAEAAKLSDQVAETQVTKMVEEYKSGKLVRTGELSTLMTSMVDDVEQLAAESQGAQAAQNIQKKNIAEAFTAGTTRAQDLLRTAQSVDPYGDVRAEAGALSTLEKIVSEARGSNIRLLEERATRDGKTLKDYVTKVVLQNRLDGVSPPESDDIIAAALEVAGDEAQIPLIRKIRRSANFNQDDVTAMLHRKETVMKTKGAFDLQADPSLAGATEQRMDASIAAMLGSTAAEDFPGMKNGAIVDYADRFDAILANSDAETDPRYRANAEDGLKKTYFNLTRSLSDPEIIRKMGDNLVPAIDIHKKLHARYADSRVNINYDDIDPRVIR
ncbi:MAG TPA: hypothetical protein VN081_06705 [Dongiaceae bacterium]|nr:hypothetical protein [Dongiaceae bacterium]